MTTLKAKLASLRAVAEAATKQKWLLSSSVMVCTPEAKVIANCIPLGVPEWALPIKEAGANAKFIATARNEFLPLLDALSEAVEALEKLDDWQGRQSCNASVYEIEDDEFGMMQFYVHNAMARVTALLGEKR